jgi:uncharacterized protein (TIGR02678 family)
MTVISQPLITTSNPEAESERRRVLRALLRNPLLPAAGETAGDYLLVRRHLSWLKHWLAKFPAWDLHFDKDVARLRKTPADFADLTRPAVDSTSDIAFSRRRYALLCLALAAIEKSERQTTLGSIAETIMGFVAADPALQEAGLVFDVSNQDQRRDLVHAVRLLLNMGLLRRVHGDEAQFLDRSGLPDALYNINRPILAVLINASRSPSAIEAANKTTRQAGVQRLSIEEIGAGIIREAPPSNEEVRTRRVRARLVRALLDDPILYLQELSAEESDYLHQQRNYLLRQIQEATGLVPEVRLEGIAMVDDSGDLTDLRLPEEGTDSHLGLLLAEWLAEIARTRPGACVPISEIQQHVARFIQVHGARWRKAVREPGAEARVTEDTLLRLHGLRLVRITADGVIPLAASGRYALAQSMVQTENQE